MQSQRAAVEHLKKGEHEKVALHGYTAYGCASPTKKHVKEAALHCSQEHGDHEWLHAHERGGDQ
ncbi:hypothetical protein GCM10023172_42900 [Hymenobacter ginsengisoli]|uniref:Uncharacterized protein n=1 Tax=Hymenobacter ginsengisoli TaxID=1051626 RepID=A0ABP8QTJ5_9BACT